MSDEELFFRLEHDQHAKTKLMQRRWLTRYGKVVSGIPGPSTRYTDDALLSDVCTYTITRIGFYFFLDSWVDVIIIKIKAKICYASIHMNNADNAEAP